MKAITIKNDIIPFKGFMAITIWPFVFVQRKQWKWYDATARRHEGIHCCQQVETLVASFVLAISFAVIGLLPLWLTLASPLVYFALYGLEYAIRLPIYDFDSHKTYRNVSFEQEAFLMEGDLTYSKRRKLFASWKYIFRTTYR